MRFIPEWDLESPAPPPFSYGIWDNVWFGWIARRLTGNDAGLQAAILSLRYAGTDDRADAGAHWVSPGVHVELSIAPTRTEVALLQMWAREHDGWYGYLTYLERHPLDPGRWAHASLLRKMSSDEVADFKRLRPYDGQAEA